MSLTVYHHHREKPPDTIYSKRFNNYYDNKDAVHTVKCLVIIKDKLFKCPFCKEVIIKKGNL